MADSGHPRKRKRYPIGKKKLLKGEKVEVRSIEDGFLGSWHAGVIIECRSGVRIVQYDHLLCDDESGFLAESVEVSSMVDGIYRSSETSNNCRGRLRPSPLVRELERERLSYGLCVDAYYNDAWWEGVIFDWEDGSDNRKIFFPDLGDEINVEIKNLRITHDWDDVTEEWKPRGKWLFLEIIEDKEVSNVIPVSIKQIWYNLRQRQEFGQIGEWASPVKPLWKKLVENIINDHLSLTLDEFLSKYDFSEAGLELNSAYSMAVVALEDIGFEDGELVTENEECMTVVAPEDVSPKALSVCSGSKGRPGRKFTFRVNFDSNENSLDSRCKRNWKPESGQLKLKLESCPKSINDYLLSNRPGNRLTKKVRNHLYSLGWKMDYIKPNGQVRIRYTSPEGQRFYNVRSVCENFNSKGQRFYDVRSVCENFNSGPQNSSPAIEHTQKKISSSSGNVNRLSLIEEPQTKKSKRRKECAVLKAKDLFVEPEYCPEAVYRYLQRVKKTYRANAKMGNNELRNEARKHLSAIGWTFWSVVKQGHDEWRYDSPTTGKIYYSLRSACKAIAREEESNTYNTSSSSLEAKGHCGGELTLFNAEAQQGSFSRRSRNCSTLRKHSVSSLLQSKEQDKLLENDGFTDGPKTKKRKALGKGNKLTRVLRSSKRVRQAGPSSFSQVPRTVLSWLIDNNVVSARRKVYYHTKKDLRPIAEGKITREGIKCRCCKKVFTLSAFEAHAGSNCHRPTANLFLEDGRSLLDCQMEVISKKSVVVSEDPLERGRENKGQSWNDHICSICHYGGELILCDLCPSSFHKDCLNLQIIPEGDWFCPSCCCGICGKSQFDVNTEQLSDESALRCHQCERQYHAHCIRDREMINLDVHPSEKWFCSKTCEKVHWGLQQLLGKPILVGHNNLTWTLIKPMHYETREHDDCDDVTMAENNSKLYVALEVMHECFEPVKEPQTGRDLVEDVMFCRSSHLNRLNFRGFYNVLLERNDELITVAILRVYGKKVAEIPLIGTRFQHRRLGMCRILMNEIEKNLMNLGVDRLVLPAAASVLNTWTTSFGFSPVTQSERSEFLGYTFLDFQDTFMCQKFLRKLPSSLSHLLRDKPGVHHEPCQNIKGSNSLLDFEGNSGISEELHQQQVEGSESVDQGAQVNGTKDEQNGGYYAQDCPGPMITDQSTNEEGEPCSTSELTDEKKMDRNNKYDGNLKFYKRKKAVELRPSVPQAGYPKVEVSCR